MNAVPKSVIVIAALVAAAGIVGSPAPVQGRVAPDPYAALPSTLQLTAIIRDFKGKYQCGGHPDFERSSTGGNGMCINTVMDELDAQGKPVLRSSGNKVIAEWKDASNRPIMDPRPYIATKTGDTAGSANASLNGSMESSTHFSQWFRDVTGVNMSKPVALTLTRTAGTNTYTFASSIDPTYVARKGFFPINGELFGNSDQGVGIANTNYHFTTEIDTEFMFERGTGQIFTFTGDDDVWVFIDRKLVVDMGGLHPAKSQSIELDRLTWLVDGQSYSLKVFHAERHRVQSNFRIDTNLRLRMVDLPPVSGMYD
jgi:fibro-slime domain-containing protein